MKHAAIYAAMSYGCAAVNNQHNLRRVRVGGIESYYCSKPKQ